MWFVSSYIRSMSWIVHIFIAQQCAQGHKWFLNKSVTDTVEIPDIYLYMYIRAREQLNALNLLFDTPCSLPVICLPALISGFILSSFQQGPKSSVSFTFRQLYLNIPLRKILHILSQSHPLFFSFFTPFFSLALPPYLPSFSPSFLSSSMLCTQIPQTTWQTVFSWPDLVIEDIYMSITSWVGAKGVSEYVQGHGNLEGNYKAHEERGGLLKRFIRLLSFFVIEAPCYVSWVLTVWLFSITATWPMEESKQVQLDLCCLVITFFFIGKDQIESSLGSWQLLSSLSSSHPCWCKSIWCDLEMFLMFPAPGSYSQRHRIKTVRTQLNKMKQMSFLDILKRKCHSFYI